MYNHNTKIILKFIWDIFRIRKSKISLNKDHLFIIYNSNIFTEKWKNITSQILTILFKTIEYSLILTFHKAAAKTIKRIIYFRKFLVNINRI